MQKRDFNIDGCIALANGIVTLAAKDYRKAIKMLQKNPKSHKGMALAMECESFFEGDWITVLTSVDGLWLMRKVREEVLKDEC